MMFWCFFGAISAIAEALFAERELDVFHFSDFFLASNFCMAEGDISIENKQHKYCSVLWYCSTV